MLLLAVKVDMLSHSKVTNSKQIVYNCITYDFELCHAIWHNSFHLILYGMNPRLISLLITFNFCAVCLGVPAKPGVLIYRQPSGDSVKVFLSGDEYSHRYTTVDGYPLVENNGTLFFATFGDSGNCVASKFTATDVDKRTSLCQSFLKLQDFEFISEIQKNEMFRKRTDAVKNSSRKNSSFGLFPDSEYPKLGRTKVIVILAEYPDKKFQESYNPRDYFERMLNAFEFNDYNATGSVRNYFMENSRGKFLPHFDLYGPVELPKPSYFYGMNGVDGNDINAAKMIVDACALIDNQTDFGQYDVDNDGIIDNVFVYYAGRGEASGGGPFTIWPHSWNIREAYEEPILFDGKILGKYACSNEWEGNRPDGIGTFVHEFSHVLGLPDLYATTYSDAFTPGNWSVMDSGSYNNNGCTPPMYSSFERYSLGWSEAKTLCGKSSVQMSDMSASDGYIIKTANENEMYFIENRQNYGWDRYIPGHGMLLWHVNYSPDMWAQNIVNDNSSIQYVDLIEAYPVLDNNVRNAHSFPGSHNITALSVQTHPAVSSWTDPEFYLMLTGIEEISDEIFMETDIPDTGIAAPSNLYATDITGHSFIAHWNPIDDAENYRLYVYTKSTDGIIEDINEFSGDSRKTDGWKISSFITSSNPENAGRNAPSIMCFKSGGYIETPKYNDKIKSFSFWNKTTTTKPFLSDTKIDLYGKGNKDWQLIASFIPELNGDGKIYSINDISANVYSLKLRIDGINGCTYYIDDCIVGYGTKAVYDQLPDFPITTGNVTEYSVENLPSDFDGAFSVESVRNESFSELSAFCRVSFIESGIKDIYREDSECHDCDSENIYFNMQGIRVNPHNLSKGIFLQLKNGKVKKIVR